MNLNPVIRFALLAMICSASITPSDARSQDGAVPSGLFAGKQDVGRCARPGAARFDAGQQSYTVSGGGANMWFTNDAFHFVWKPVSGDVTLAARIAFVGASGQAHRKACLLVRQSLDSDSAYADAALHGDGLTSLQYREAAGARTYEIQANASAPQYLRIEKLGDYVSMSLSPDGQNWQPAGGSFRLKLRDPFYVGLGVCAHDDSALETAAFSDVQLQAGLVAAMPPPLFSTLETVDIASKDRRVVYGTTTTACRRTAHSWSSATSRKRSIP